MSSRPEGGGPAAGRRTPPRCVDFHAHVLPGMDHGCSGLQTALAQLAGARSAGVGVVVATPHYYPQNETVSAFLARRGEALERLARAGHTAPVLLAGAEVLLCRRMEQMAGVDRLCVSGTNTLLLELPFGRCFEPALVCSATALAAGGLRVVLAHAERYPAREVEKLLAAGIRVQVNADYYLSPRKWLAVRRYLQAGQVAALGSDVHGMGRQYRQFRTALRMLGAQAEAVMESAGRLIAPEDRGTKW